MDRYGINETENNAMKMMEKSSAHLADLETEAFSYAAQGDAKRATETMYSEDYMKGEAEVQKQYKIFDDSIVRPTAIWRKQSVLLLWCKPSVSAS